MCAPTASPRSLRMRQAAMLQWLLRVGSGAESLKAAFSPSGHLSSGAPAEIITLQCINPYRVALQRVDP